MRQRPSAPALIECSCPSCSEHRLRLATTGWIAIAIAAFAALVAVPAFLAWCSSF